MYTCIYICNRRPRWRPDMSPSTWAWLHAKLRHLQQIYV